MEGFLVLFNSETKRDIVDINHTLFGRIAYSTRGKYYYSGFLEDVPYSKLTKGCYFTVSKMDDLAGKIKIIKATLDISPESMITAKEHWQKHIVKNKLVVKNI